MSEVNRTKQIRSRNPPRDSCRRTSTRRTATPSISAVECPIQTSRFRHLVSLMTSRTSTLRMPSSSTMFSITDISIKKRRGRRSGCCADSYCSIYSLEFWSHSPHWFKSCKISAIALIKMVSTPGLSFTFIHPEETLGHTRAFRGRV